MKNQEECMGNINIKSENNNSFPLYSVLMSVYEKEQPGYLALSIESILNQTVKPSQFVIVCDGPLTKELDDVIKKYENYENDKDHESNNAISGNAGLFKIVRLEQNVGLGIALNEGLKYCSNELVARMDSDDISVPDRIEKELELMKSTGAELVSGAICEFEDESQVSFLEDIGNKTNFTARKRVVPTTEEEIKKFMKKRNPFNHPAVMYKKSTVQKAGGYLDFKGFEDYYLWVRMILNGCVCANTEDILVYMRVGNGMHKRRGGMEYARNAVRFQKYLYKSRVIGLPMFIYTAFARTVVALIPNKLRAIVYNTAVRKQ